MNKSLFFLAFSLGAAAGAAGGGAIAASGDQIIETNPHGEGSAQLLACTADCLIDADPEPLITAAREDVLAVSTHVDTGGKKPVYRWAARQLEVVKPKDAVGKQVLGYVE